MHYYIIIAIVIVIVVLQVGMFDSTRKKIKNFKSIFPKSDSSYKHKQTMLDEIQNMSDIGLQTMLQMEGQNIEHFTKIMTQNNDIRYLSPVSQEVFDRNAAIRFLKNSVRVDIASSHKNSILDTVISAINDYLSSNKGAVSDFHLIKDVVDRNCDAKEDDLQTQIPIPLYLGLGGTMLGILIGVGFFVFDDGLSALLNEVPDWFKTSYKTAEEAAKAWAIKGSDGVMSLLGGVALAMIASFVGIVFTTISSYMAKSAKLNVEDRKHIFLTWLQVNLLPNLSNDTSSALVKMSQNLAAFNSTFSKNTADFGKILNGVNKATDDVASMLSALNSIDVYKIASANIGVYEKLKNCTAEIGLLGEYLKNTNDYLANVRILNEKLDKNEQRTKAIEEMATFFQKEISQIEQRQKTINKAVGTVDSILEERLRKLAEHAGENVESFSKSLINVDSILEERLRKLAEHAVTNVENFNRALGKQQEALHKKLDETQMIVSELKNLSAIKESIAKFEKTMSSQNSKLDALANSIQALAKAKSEGTDMPVIDQPKPKMPVWKKVLISALSATGGILLLSLIIANWATIYHEFINLFRF